MNEKVTMDIQSAIALIENKKALSLYTQYQTGGKIHLMTNEDLNQTFKNLKLVPCKRALTVCSGGDQPLNIASYGVKTIDCFDSNRFTKYFLDFKIAAIEVLDYQTFLSFFYKTKDSDLLFSNEIYEAISPCLKGNSKCFFDALFGAFEGRKIYASRLFASKVPVEIGIYRNHYLESEENYNQLKLSLNACQFQFIEQDLLGVPHELKASYDMIYLSNIADFLTTVFPVSNSIELEEQYKNITGMDIHSALMREQILDMLTCLFTNDEKNNPNYHFRNFIVNELAPHLNEQGMIYCAYLFERIMSPNYSIHNPLQYFTYLNQDGFSMEDIDVLNTNGMAHHKILTYQKK